MSLLIFFFRHKTAYELRISNWSSDVCSSDLDNKTQRSEYVRLRQRETAIDQRISSALESERASLRRDQAQLANERQQSEGLLQDLQRRLESLGNTDLPVGLGLREGDADGLGADAGIRWVEPDDAQRSEEHTSELQSPMRISYAVFCLQKTK